MGTADKILRPYMKHGTQIAESKHEEKRPVGPGSISKWRDMDPYKWVALFFFHPTYRGPITPLFKDDDLPLSCLFSGEYTLELLRTYQNHVDKLMTSQTGRQGDADNVDRADFPENTRHNVKEPAWPSSMWQ